MTRVATYAQDQQLLADLMRIQGRVFTSQQQISTGKKAQSFQELGTDASGLLAAKSVEGRANHYVKVSQEVLRRLELQDLQLDALATAGAELRQSVLDAIATDKAIGLPEALDAVFKKAVSVLNASYDGSKLFGGTRTDTDPVTVTSVAALVAAPSISGIFANDAVKPEAEIDEALSVEYGFLASDIGAGLMGAIQRIAAIDAGPLGPLSGDLTQAQRQALEGELAGLAAMAEDLNATVAANGNRHAVVEDKLAAHKDAQALLKGFISDIEDVDLAEAVTRLQADQTAMQAAAQVFGALQRSSLLDFLR
ncbi:MAG: hypothetical protein HXY25_12745 [Alphaproteobacteria bacterium]|nr:hypothetical protein [Alphaproteobacteria bacterium]